MVHIDVTATLHHSYSSDPDWDIASACVRSWRCGYAGIVYGVSCGTETQQLVVELRFLCFADVVASSYSIGCGESPFTFGHVIV